MAAAGCGGPGPSGKPAAGRTLRVACFGGDIEAQARSLVGDVIEGTLGCQVQYETGTSRTFLQRLREMKDKPPQFDVVYLDGEIQDIAVKEGLLEPIRQAELQFYRELSTNAWVNREFGPGIQFFSVGLAYNSSGFASAGIPAPTSWSDLWTHAERLKGRIGIPDIVHTAGMDLLLVAMDLEGKTLADPDGPARGIARIQALEPALVFTSSTDAADRLARGELWVTPTYNSRAFSKELSGAPVEWVTPREKGFGHVTCACVVKGSPQRDLALAWLNVATSVPVQLAQSLGAPFGPTNTLTYEVLQGYPAVSRRFPLGPSDFGNLRIPPWEEVNRRRAEIEDAWHKVFPRP